MAGMFDDLVPASPASAGTPAGGMFDDLVPEAPKAEKPSLLARAKDLFTGELRTEFPDAPEFLQAYVGASKNMPDGADAGAVNRSAITPDPKAQVDILKKHIPGLEEKTDKFGNIMLKAPGMDDFAYLNKPGASGRDLDELGTQTLATLPFFGALGLGGNIFGRAAVGAGVGGAASVAQDAAAVAQGSEQGIDGKRAGISALISGGLAPLVGTPAKQAAQTAGQAAVEAGERIGVQIPKAAASDSLIPRRVGASIAEMPIVGDPLVKASKRSMDQLEQAADNVVAGYGQGSAFTAGSAAKEAMRDWVTGGSKAVQDRLYGEVDRLVNPNATRPLAETQQTIQKLLAEQQASRSSVNDKAIELVADAATDPHGLTYEGLKALRTEIGARISGSILPEPGTSMPALKRLYAALTDDLEVLVNAAGGGPAVKAFERANNISRMVSQRREDLARIIGTDASVSPERVFERLAQMAGSKGSADITKLMLARKAVGSDAWDEVAAGVVARLGRDAQGNFSPMRFLTDYGKLSENGKNALFQTTGKDSLRKSLDDIATVSQRFADIQRYANPSGTGRVAATGAGIAGFATAPLALVGGMIGTASLARLLARPATAKTVATWSKAYLAAATNRNRATMAAFQQASERLADAAKATGAGELPQEAQQ